MYSTIYFMRFFFFFFQKTFFSKFTWFNRFTHPMAYWHHIGNKGVNSVLYRPVSPEYTVPTSKPVHITPLVSYRKKYQPYRLISSNTRRLGRYKKKVFFFCFLSFVIFEFLLRQNCNCKDLICNDSKVVLGSYVKSPNNKICRAWAERLGLVTG